MTGHQTAKADQPAPAGQSSVEDDTRQFYDTVGWVTDDRGVIGEDRFFRGFGAGQAAYGAKVDRKPAELLRGFGGTVLFAGPGDLPTSHQAVAEGFDRVVCADISERSLEICKAKLGDKGAYHRASALDLPFTDGSMDAALCAHVLYHIDRTDQGQAVSELIRATKPGGRVVIVYCNPRSPLMLVQRLLKALAVNKLLGKNKLYTHYFPLDWWQQFSAGNRITVHPHDVISANQAKTLLPVAVLRRAFFDWASRFEARRPKLACRLWTYVAITIDVDA